MARRVVFGGAALLIAGAWLVMMIAWGGNNRFANVGDSPMYMTSVPFSWLTQVENGPDLPIVVADPNGFMMLHHYGPPAILARLVYVADVKLSVSYLGMDTTDRNLVGLSQFVPLPVEGFESFRRKHGRFLVCGYDGSGFEWLLSKLKTDRAELRLIRKHGAEYVRLAQLSK